MPDGCPGPGCTTMPAGLSTIHRWLSSNRVGRSMASGSRCKAGGAGSGSSVSTVAPARIRVPAFSTTSPFTRTLPARTQASHRERANSG